MIKVQFLLLVFASIAFSQVSQTLYSDDKCTKSIGALYTKPLCLENRKVECSQDRKSIVTNIYGNSACTGAISSSTTLSEVGKCVASISGYGIFSCGTSGVDRSRVTVTASIGGCIANSLSYVYSYSGCNERADKKFIKTECSGSTSTSTVYSDNACTQGEPPIVTNTGICQSNFTETACGLKGLESSAVSLSLGFLLFLMIFWF